MTLRSLISESDVSSELVWVNFTVDWKAYWKKTTNKPFVYKHVNSRCAYVAHVMRGLLESQGVEGIRERYGFFDGAITNPYWLRRGIGFMRHGWLDIQGVIVDPTRWCFIGLYAHKLALCSSKSKDYDAGMNCARHGFFRPLPEFNAAKKVLCNNPHILDLFEGEVCRDRLAWLANIPPGDLLFESEDRRIAMFKWMQDNGQAALIPWDNRV